ncbi:ketopantoate reductase family protein [Marinomonas algicola]|uniref:ketopantoate reductase family protein n=1 Tax=Marinomonas algicola TaxID=2773454 RepID=UPI00174D36D4|nr:2-dehydropantoate 2-reductase [Marinomonas algicola]
MTSQTHSTTWLIIGAGAIGLLWACKLTKAGQKVILINRQCNGCQNVQHIHEGITSNYEIEYSTIELLNNSCSQNQLTQVLICTKAFDQPSAYNEIKHRLSPNAFIISLCNGVGSQATLQNLLIHQHALIVGTTSEGALKHSSTKVEQTGKGEHFFGFFDENQAKNTVLPNEILLFKDENIMARILSKAIINAVINPITSINNITNGNLLSAPYKEQAIAAIDELIGLLQNPDFIRNNPSINAVNTEREHVNSLVFSVAKNTSKNRSSMLEDVSNRRKTEIEFISGFFITEAKKIQFPMPIQSAFLHKINNV